MMMMSSTRGNYFGFVVVLTWTSLARSECNLRTECTADRGTSNVDITGECLISFPGYSSQLCTYIMPL